MTAIEKQESLTLDVATAIELTKPRILTMALLTGVVGMHVAPGELALRTMVLFSIGCIALVGSANTLNMYLERDIDCLMTRTRNRPLPTGRVSPENALLYGFILGILATGVLTFGVNPLTGLLGTIAMVCYVNLYTPLKRRTTVATWIGAIPGAMPALMGYTAQTNSIGIAGLAVFFLLFIWQIPHFYAIALFREKEYTRAGVATLPDSMGTPFTKHAILLYAGVQFAISMMVYLVHAAGPIYLGAAIIFGVGYFWVVARGWNSWPAPKWAKSVFVYSVVYLPCVFISLVVDANF